MEQQTETKSTLKTIIYILGEWTRAGSEGIISELCIDAPTGQGDPKNIDHPQHFTSTPLRSLRDGYDSKILQPKTKGRIYSPAITPTPSKSDENSEGSNIKKISQGSDCLSYADSGFVCDRTDSMIEYDIATENYCKEGRRTQR